MAAYLGYPKAQQSLSSLERVLVNSDTPQSAELDRPSDEDRFQRGIGDYNKLNADALQNINTAFGELAPDMVTLTFRSYGDVFAQSNQTLVLRQLATVAALAVAANAAPQLKFTLAPPSMSA